MAEKAITRSEEEGAEGGPRGGGEDESKRAKATWGTGREEAGPGRGEEDDEKEEEEEEGDEEAEERRGSEGKPITERMNQEGEEDSNEVEEGWKQVKGEQEMYLVPGKKIGFFFGKVLLDFSQEDVKQTLSLRENEDECKRRREGQT